MPLVGSQQDYGMRIYNAALGKFLSVDPLTKEYPELTPYQFSSNTPIMATDLDGGEARVVIFGYKEVDGHLAYGVKYDGEIDVQTFNVVHHAMGIPIYNPLKNNGTIYFLETDEHVGKTTKMNQSVFGPVYKWYYFGKDEKGNDDKRTGEFPVAAITIDHAGLTDAVMVKLLTAHYSNVSLLKRNSQARNLLQKAMQRQNLNKVPVQFKEKWSEEGIDYEVRVHGPQKDAPTGTNSNENTTFRVARRKQGVDQNGQGYGWEYADDNNNWYKQSDLKNGKNEDAANETHIIIKKK